MPESPIWIVCKALLPGLPQKGPSGQSSIGNSDPGFWKVMSAGTGCTTPYRGRTLAAGPLTSPPRSRPVHSGLGSWTAQGCLFVLRIGGLGIPACFPSPPWDPPAPSARSPQSLAAVRRAPRPRRCAGILERTSCAPRDMCARAPAAAVCGPGRAARPARAPRLRLTSRRWRRAARGPSPASRSPLA